MAILSGDKLKTQKDFKEEIEIYITRVHGQNVNLQPGNFLDQLLDSVAYQMFHQQQDWHNFMVNMGCFPGLQPGQANESFDKEYVGDFDYGPNPDYQKKKVCCNPEDLKWYDSGFSRFQYCTVCNKDHK